MTNVFPVLGFDIGGTKIAACLGNSKGEIYGSKRIDNKERAPESVLAEMAEAGFQLLEEANIPKEDLAAVGVGSPSPLDIPNGMILQPPNMKKWKNVAIRDFLAEKFKAPTYLDNDANGGALAEWLFGAGQKSENMLYLTMSTGIGGGIIAHSHLVRGKIHIAGEVGHIVIDVNGPECNCGMKGCYEAFCGGRALAQRMQLELANQLDHPIVKYAGGNIADIDMICLEKAVRDGNEYAVKLWDEMIYRNAQAIGTFINMLNPERIVLGTLAWATGDLFMEPLMKYLPAFCWEDMRKSCTVTVSDLGRKIGEYAGISIALNFLYEEGKWQLPWQSE